MSRNIYLAPKTELYHYGIKGMKWGVRRYQNKDGSLTLAGKRKAAMDNYKDIGASKRLQRHHGYETLKEAKLLDTTSEALKRLQSNDNNPDYTNKQRAKDYDTAIRSLNRLRANEPTRSYYDRDQFVYNEKRIARLQKNPSEKKLKKIKQLSTDNELIGLDIKRAAEKYEKYNEMTNTIIDRMSNDKAVVYTTRYRTLSMVGGDQGYEFRGTDYKVRANNKRRANGKKYNEAKRKKRYNDSLNKYYTVYV